MKGRKSPIGENSTILRLLLRMSKSPQQVATLLDLCKIRSRSTGNQNGGRETGTLCSIPEIAERIYVKFQRNPHICLARRTWRDECCPTSG